MSETAPLSAAPADAAPADAAPADAAPSDAAVPDTDSVRADIIRVIRTVFDPEIPVNIYDMGLIYGIDLTPLENGQFDAHIRMTLTSPNCPSAQELPASVGRVAETVEGVAKASVAIVWDPPWTRAMMSEDAMLTLGFY